MTEPPIDPRELVRRKLSEYHDADLNPRNVRLMLAAMMEGHWGWGNLNDDAQEKHEVREYSVDLHRALLELCALAKSGSIRVALNSPYPRNHLRPDIPYAAVPLFDVAPFSLLAQEHMGEDEVTLPAPLIDAQTYRELYLDSTYRLAAGTFTLPYPTCFFVTHEMVNGCSYRFWLRAIQSDPHSIRIECIGNWDILTDLWVHPGVYSEVTINDDGSGIAATRVMGSKRIITDVNYETDPDDQNWSTIGASHFRAVGALVALLGQGTVRLHDVEPVAPTEARKLGSSRTRSMSLPKEPLPKFKRIDLTGFKYRAPADKPKGEPPSYTMRPTTRRAHLRQGEPVPVADIHGGDQELRHYKVNLKGKLAKQAPVAPEPPAPGPTGADVELVIKGLEALIETCHADLAAELRETIVRLQKRG